MAKDNSRLAPFNKGVGMKDSDINQLRELNNRIQSRGFSWSHADYFLLEAILPEIIETLKEAQKEESQE